MNRARGIYDESEEMDGNYVGILTIPATTRNNNSVIYCRLAGTTGVRDSPSVALTVQGDLDTVHRDNCLCNSIMCQFVKINCWHCKVVKIEYFGSTL